MSLWCAHSHGRRPSVPETATAAGAAPLLPKTRLGASLVSPRALPVSTTSHLSTVTPRSTSPNHALSLLSSLRLSSPHLPALPPKGEACSKCTDNACFNCVGDSRVDDSVKSYVSASHQGLRTCSLSPCSTRVLKMLTPLFTSPHTLPTCSATPATAGTVLTASHTPAPRLESESELPP